MTENGKKQFRILKRDRLLDGYFEVDEYVLTHSLTRGGEGPPVTRFVLHRPDAVAVVLFHSEKNEYIMVKQFRAGLIEKEGNPWLIELPAGLVDQGESPENSIKREILEETGYQVEKLKLLHTAYASPGIISERFFIYYAEVNESQKVEKGGGEPGDEEDIEVVMFDRKAMAQAIRNGQVQDAKTLLGIYAAGGLIG